MVNFTKATNYAVKDNLVSGDPAKIIRGTEIDAEFNSLQVVTASKADTNSPSFTGVPTATTAGVGTNTTQIATTAFAMAAMIASYPVGSIYMATVSTSPTTLLGFGTWVAFGAGRVMMAAGGAFAAGSSGGSNDAIVPIHTHTATSSVTDTGHNHDAPYAENGTGPFGNSSRVNVIGSASTDYDNRGWLTSTATTGVTVGTTIDGVGVSVTNANLQPYIVVYMWNRTA